jgi:hypothetical protein
MIPKQSQAQAPVPQDAPTVTSATPSDVLAPLRCIQRPTGEWFTLAAGNAPGRDTPDATELWTDAEARERLAARGLAPDAIEAQLARARANAEVTGDIADWPPPVPEA